MEATLTSDKDFKHLVRAEARRSGSSYTAARRRLLEKQTGDLVNIDAMRQVEKQNLALAYRVPTTGPSSHHNPPTALTKWPASNATTGPDTCALCSVIPARPGCRR